jgi:Protein of unknown function (DUF3223)
MAIAGSSAARQQPGEAKLTGRQYGQLKAAQRIRDEYADGQPLTGKGYDLVYSLLQQHPRAQAKIGSGVQAITVDKFIGGSKCYFVLRTDGTCEDSGPRQCLGQTQRRSDRV